MNKRIYNVRIAIVDLVEATTEQEAIEILAQHLRLKGFEPYDGDEGNAFASEPLHAGCVVLTRAGGKRTLRADEEACR